MKKNNATTCSTQLYPQYDDIIHFIDFPILNSNYRVYATLFCFPPKVNYLNK